MRGAKHARCPVAASRLPGYRKARVPCRVAIDTPPPAAHCDYRARAGSLGHAASGQPTIPAPLTSQHVVGRPFRRRCDAGRLGAAGLDVCTSANSGHSLLQRQAARVHTAMAGTASPASIKRANPAWLTSRAGRIDERDPLSVAQEGPSARRLPPLVGPGQKVRMRSARTCSRR
jgi:hypothetical protein